LTSVFYREQQNDLRSRYHEEKYAPNEDEDADADT
jgi:hypothetical protein